MNGFLPLMNYGDQLAREDSSPLVNQSGGGATGTSAPGNQIVGGVVPGGLNGGPTVQGGLSNMTIAAGYLPSQGTNGCPPCNCAQKSPFENETVQYALLFALLYVVIKKL